nr:MAG TPA: stabilization protein [Caudoviricetes sp.]
MSEIRITNFSGGMNDWIDPTLLPEGVSVQLRNADISTGKIRTIRKPLLLEGKNAEDFGHYGNRDRSVVKWYDRYYWSENAALKAPYYGGNPENYLGIPYPLYSGDCANVKVSSADVSAGSVAGTEEAAGLTGDYKYCVCFCNVNGWEGAPGSLEEYEVAITFAGQAGKVQVSWDESRVSRAKVYRTIDHGAEFYCVGEIKESGGELIDVMPDTEAQMQERLSSERNYPPPDGGKYLCEYSGVFFLAVDSLLYFSIQGNPHAWPVEQFLQFDDTITGIAPEFSGVLVFTRNNTYRVTGAEDVSTVVKSFIPGNHGCVTNRSIAYLSNSPVWLSNDGLCMWDGSNVLVPSYRRIRTKDIGVLYAVSADDCYYLFQPEGCLVFDRRNGDVFYKLDVICDYAWYDGETDILYLQRGGVLYQYGTGEELPYLYESPLLGSGKMSVFREVTADVAGRSVVSVYIDGQNVASVSVGPGVSRIRLPFRSVGRWCKIVVSGRGGLSALCAEV